jgi:GrpB-like predicted nucleotidyltransferase (UPF0157 family)
METLEQRIQRVVRENVAIVPYDPLWPRLFQQEKDHLLSCFPGDLIRRVEHFGSTAVPGLAAKPVVDVLVEVADLEVTQREIVPVLESQGYDYFWRSKSDDNSPPFYAWFIKRNPTTGGRTHHIHMVEKSFVEHWECLLFRDYLIEHRDVAAEYQALKLQLAAEYPNDREAYTRGKTEFVLCVTKAAKQLTRRFV